MCGVCGCSQRSASDHHHGGHEHVRAPRTIQLERDLFAKNDRIARKNRHWLEHQPVLAVNLIGSPGAGKTALLEATIRALGAELELAVIEGDQATSRDTERIERAGCRALQINTGTGCHLDASMLEQALAELSPRPGSALFVENVGNLVCPALFDLGERLKVVVMSVTEGEDKPLKYPHVFRAADLFVLTKIDLLGQLDFDADECIELAHSLDPDLPVLRLSARTGEGVDAWCSFVRQQAGGMLAARSA